jgi:hypothetical protein
MGFLWLSHGGINIISVVQELQYLIPEYCGMSAESQNSLTRRDVCYYVMTQ